MSVSLEPVDVPETVESETNPTPTQIEEQITDEAPESVPTISTTCERSVRSQGSENPVEAREGIPMVCTDSNTKIPVKKRGRPRKEVPKEPKTPKAAPKKAVRMTPPSPVNEVNESSSEEETPLTRDDMETLLLDYLVKRKQPQQQARMTMWSQLVGLS